MFLIHTFGLWVIYVFVMYLKRKRDYLRARGGWRLILGYIVAVTGWVLDVLYNIVWGSVIFLQLPHYSRLTFTARLKYNKTRPGWRNRLAIWFCETLLNPYDSGHC